LDIAFWAKKNVEVIKAGFDDFMRELVARLPPISRVVRVEEQVLELPIRKHYRTKATESELLRGALETDLTLVRDGMPVSPQNPKKFYEGYDTGWGAIAQSLDFPRKVVEEILYQSVLEEKSQTGARLFVLKGPAGSGKTIAMKRAAWEAAASLECLVLWMDQAGALNPEVFIELYGLTSKRIFVFVDRGALHVDKVDALLHIAQQRNIPLTVIVAERYSEWNVYCAKLQRSWHPVELRLGNLSVNEIEALLDLLKKHDALGLLTEKSRPDQVKAFSEKADRQLLVALHEVTLGKPFEDIVFEEYQRIVPQEAQRLYLDICTLNQFGVRVRAGMISRISGIRFKDYEADFFDPLEKIILTSRDPYSGDFQYRARHSRVASLVFRQACPSDEERIHQLVRMIHGFDIGYSIDRHALEDLTRGRRLAETLRSADSGRQIYEAALEIAPDTAFLFQQWAIFEMNHLSGSLSKADGLANRGRDIDPKSTAIIHTQAEISRRLALEAKSPLLKEQLRKQSRARLSEIGANDNNSYVASTRCKLHVDELEDLLEVIGDKPRPQDEQALIEKARDTETALSRATQQFPDEPDLMQIEARLRELLKQKDRAIRALERALAAGPKGSGVAIRLARAYRDRKLNEKALTTLEQVLENNPDDKQACIEIAKLLLSDPSASREKIERYFARSYDKGDNNFDARFLHAQYLFMIGKASEAMALFEEIDRLANPEFRQMPPSFDTPVTALLGRYNGAIEKKADTYIFIRSSVYPPSIYASDRTTEARIWQQLEFGTEVNFKVSFNRKGPVAIDLREGRI